MSNGIDNFFVLVNDNNQILTKYSQTDAVLNFIISENDIYKTEILNITNSNKIKNKKHVEIYDFFDACKIKTSPQYFCNKIDNSDKVNLNLIAILIKYLSFIEDINFKQDLIMKYEFINDNNLDNNKLKFKNIEVANLELENINNKKIIINKILNLLENYNDCEIFVKNNNCIMTVKDVKNFLNNFKIMNFTIKNISVDYITNFKQIIQNQSSALKNNQYLFFYLEKSNAIFKIKEDRALIGDKNNDSKILEKEFLIIKKNNNNLELVNENYNKELTQTINNILLKINLEDNIVQKNMVKIKNKI